MRPNVRIGFGESQNIVFASTSIRRLNEEGDGGEIGQEPGGEGGTEGGGDDEGAGGAEGSPESFGRLLSWPSGPSGPGGGSSMSSSLSLSGSSGAATPRLPSA